MALKNSGFGGTGTLHELKGCSCDLCGKEADSETAELTALDCSFKACDPHSSVYHQACLERYLKSIKCERNRKIGFPCPRGCGKATKFSQPCPGKILKSHPISIRGEANKKRRQAELESLQRTESRDKEAGAKAAKKEDGKGGGSRKEGAGSPGDDKGGGAKGGKTVKQPSIKALNVGNTKLVSASSAAALAAQPAKSAAAAKKEALAAEARKLKNEIAARAGGGGAKSAGLSSTSSATSLASHVSKAKEVRTLDEYLAERQAGVALDRATSAASSIQPAAGNAWAAKSRASSASSLATESGPGDSWLPNLDSDFPPPPAAAAPPAKPPVPLPRTASSASASTSSSAVAAAAVPAPAKPQVPRGAWAQKQPAVMSIVPPPPPPPRAMAAAAPPAPPAAPSPRAAAAAAAAPPSPAAAAAHQVEESQPKLSKSQRKNLRRAEKKAAKEEAAAAVTAAEAQDASPAALPPLPPPGFGPGAGAAAVAPPSPSGASLQQPLQQQQAELAYAAPAAGAQQELAAAGHDSAGASAAVCGDLLDRCLQLVVQHKLQKQVEGLASLGFAPAAALAAVQQHGGNLEAAVTTLLEQATGMCDGMPSFAGSQGPLPEVDLSEELALMQALQCRYRLAPGVLEAAVVECNGDLDTTARAVAEQCGDVGSSGGSSGSTLMLGSGGGLDLYGAGAGLFPPAAAAGSPLSTLPAQQADSAWAAWGEGPPSSSLHSSRQPLGSAPGAGSSLFGSYSAFSFGGFTEAALHAVHGDPAAGQPASLFGSLDASTPRGSSSGLWGEAAQASPQHSSPGYGGAQLVSGGAPSRVISPFDRPVLPLGSSSHGSASRGGGTFPGLVADSRPEAGGGLFGGGLTEQQQQAWGAAAAWGQAAGQQQQQQGQYGQQRLLQERDLSDLMSTLVCR